MRRHILNTLMAISLIGCAHKHVEVQSYTAFLDTFETTGSPCLDGLTINMAKVGCDTMHTGQSLDGTAMSLQCMNPDANHITSPWATAIYLISENSDSLPEEAFFVCLDHQLTVVMIPTVPMELPPKLNHDDVQDDDSPTYVK